MSGQPYKYYTDVEKYRNEYLDSLNLQSNINEMNHQANKNYKETGALPAVSQMKDNRTTSEILADTEKLKIDVVQSLSKISNPQFASAVVQYILNSPINQDNRLLIFTAQRINDISDKLTKIYTYGIKGDQNDIQQFVNFVISMYNDKNAIASSTKDFLSKYGSSNLGQFSGTSRGGAYASLHNTLLDLLGKLNIMLINVKTEYESYSEPPMTQQSTQIRMSIRNLINTMNELNTLVRYIIDLIPSDELLRRIDEILHNVVSSDPSIINYTKGPDETTLINYKDYINSSLPNFSHISLTLTKVETYYTVYIKYITELKTVIRNRNPRQRTLSQEQMNNYNINLNSFSTSLLNMLEILAPNELYQPDRIRLLSRELQQSLRNLIANDSRPRNEGRNDSISENDNIARQIDDVSNRILHALSSIGSDYDYLTYHNIIDDARRYPDREKLQALLDIEFRLNNPHQPAMPPIEESGGAEESKSDLVRPGTNPDEVVLSDAEVIEEIDRVSHQISTHLINNPTDEDSIFTYNDLINDARRHPSIEKLRMLRNIESRLSPNEQIDGSGIRRRGRPRGSGIQRKYADVVKRSIIDGKGIQEDMRFIKFGKYLINNKKLNDGILAVKRPSGNNILEFPSQRISKNMQSVIKTMVGGGMPKYEQFECLSEPEKAYLHKLSSKANILDKFSIPAPSKSQYEKDIHDFEVMKGEIMSGNDNKDLIKKFKLHIMKLSKMGSLPKHDVSDILETLIQLGY